MAQRARSNNYKGKKKFIPRNEEQRPAFVPRNIEAQYRAIKEVKDVKPVESTPRHLQITLVLDREYSHELHSRLLMITYDIQRSLKGRNQKFDASFAW